MKEINISKLVELLNENTLSYVEISDSKVEITSDPHTYFSYKGRITITCADEKRDYKLFMGNAFIQFRMITPAEDNPLETNISL